MDKLVDDHEEEEEEEEEEMFVWKCEFCAFENILRGVDCLEELPQVFISFFFFFILI